ncbi:MAG: amidohydrolase family protein [Thermoleophilaceae bacterium]
MDVHSHFLPGFLLEEEVVEGRVFGVPVEDDPWPPPLPELFEPAAKLSDMDDRGIDVSAVSTGEFFYDPPDQALLYARRANDALAEFVDGTDRLVGLATLPLATPEEAADELERSVRELGFRGAEIGTSVSSKVPLDRAGLDPLFERASALEVPLLLHPWRVGPVQDQGYALENAVGYPLDTFLAAARLCLGGVFDRWPSLRIVLVHAGGCLPYQLGRIDHAYAVRDEARAGAARPPSSYLAQFWIDTITHSDAALTFLATLVGPDRLVLGTDLPYDMADRDSTARLKRVGIDAHVLGKTAQELLQL